MPQKKKTDGSIKKTKKKSDPSKKASPLRKKKRVAYEAAPKKIRVTIFKNNESEKKDIFAQHVIPVRKKATENPEKEKVNFEAQEKILAERRLAEADGQGWPEGKKRLVFWTAVIGCSLLVFSGWLYMFKHVVVLDVDQKYNSLKEDSMVQEISRELSDTMERIISQYNRMKEAREELQADSGAYGEDLNMQNFVNNLSEEELALHLPLVRDITTLVSESWEYSVKTQDFSSIEKMNTEVNPIYSVNLIFKRQCDCQAKEGCPEKPEYSLYFFSESDEAIIKQQSAAAANNAVSRLCGAPKEIFRYKSFIVFSYCNDHLNCNQAHEALEELLKNNYQ